MLVRNQDIRPENAKSIPMSWAEYAQILEERPATLQESYIKAINAVAKVHAQGHITDGEASALLRLASGQYIAVAFEGVIRSLEEWTPAINSWGFGSSHAVPNVVWQSREP